jgi:hypothetical protein
MMIVIIIITNYINTISVFHVAFTYCPRAIVIVFVVIIIIIVIIIILNFFVIIIIVFIIIIIMQLQVLLHCSPQPSYAV